MRNHTIFSKSESFPMRPIPLWGTGGARGGLPAKRRGILQSRKTDKRNHSFYPDRWDTIGRHVRDSIRGFFPL
jgi:hypothetical protein